RLAAAGLQAGQRTDRDAGDLGELGQRRAASLAESAQAQTHGRQDRSFVVCHTGNVTCRIGADAAPWALTTSRGKRTVDDTYDVVVVGGGPAGLSGALALARARRSVLVIDAGDPRNAPAGHVHNYLAREGTSPAELVAAGRDEVTRYGGQIVAGRVE